MVSVHVIQGPDKGRTYELPDGESVIGRVSETVELSDRTVSRRHARMFPLNGTWKLEDLGAANGTYLNGVKIRKAMELHRGDQIRCGQTLLVFGGESTVMRSSVDVDESGQLVDVAIVESVPSDQDSVIIPTPEAGARAIGNLRIIYDLIRDVSSIFNVDQLLTRVLDKVFEVLKADRGYIMLLDEETGELVLKASRLSQSAVEQQAPPISRTMINEVLERKRGVLSSNAMTDKRFASGKSVHNFGIRSAICVPLMGRENIVGVLHTDCSVAEHTYSTEQLRLLTAIGYHTGLAVENVRLYEQNVQSERLAAVGEAVALLSHHTKNILQALSSGVDVVEAGLESDNLEKAKSGWPIVQRNLDRINHLILNMLAYSKEREPSLENTNLNTVMEDCLELIGPQADNRSVALLSDLDEHLPPVPADAAGIHQAFLNLLNNALDAVEDETGAITVKSWFDEGERKVCFQVIDNGKGIPPEKLSEIFHPFYSAKGQRGTGLGLAVTQKVAREHRGHVDVESQPGEGTTFTVVLPTLPGQDAGETAGPAATPAG